MISLQEEVKKRTPALYADKPKFKHWMQIEAKIIDGIIDASLQLVDALDIDKAFGVQLDNIGEIVGIKRSILDTIEFTPSYCGDDNNQTGNDELTQCSPEYVTQDLAVSDEYYRILLKAQIAKNTSNCSPEDTIQALQIILNGSEIIYLNEGHLAITFDVAGLTDPQREALRSFDIVPRGAGIRFEGFLEMDRARICGDESAECGNDNFQCVGAITPPTI